MLMGVLCVFANTSLSNTSVGGKNIGILTSDRNLQTLFSDIMTYSLPKEKVYLHLDNTSYYKDDTLWFSAYLVNSDGNTSDAVSKTLYVDLLNPGGDIIDTKVLKIENGRAHGSFKINCTPFYSGFFEIRAYTKYMMNFGPETAFSRVIPVFDAPKKEGDYQKRNMRGFGTGQYQYWRKYPEKGKDFDVKFYPEGGRLIKGIPTKVTFEAKDKNGHPIDIQGHVLSSNRDTVISFKTEHEGKGVFSIIPDGTPMVAEVRNNGKTKKLDLPETFPSGYSLSVDNTSNSDSIYVTINRAGKYNSKDTVGVAITSHGILKVYTALASSFRKPVQVAFARKELSSGVAEATLIDVTGRKIADRMFFNPLDDNGNIYIKYDFNKKEYRPYEAVDMTVTLTDHNGIPVTSPFSMSVRDGNDEVECNRNIMTDLLLMSDIKGYISNPGYYFESTDSVHRNHLDLLMMVQGWRKYSWESLGEQRIENLRFQPEDKGIEIAGTVRSLTNKPMSDVDVTAFLINRDIDDEKTIPPMDMTRTDSTGRFSFTVNIDDIWTLILNTAQNNKLIHSQISLDKEFVPQPRQYYSSEMEVSSSSKQNDLINKSLEQSKSPDSGVDDDFSSSKSSDDKSIWLEELEVKSKRSWKDNDREQTKHKSVAYYDVNSEINAIRDNGGYIDLGADIHDLLMKKNPEFSSQYINGEQTLLYKFKYPIIVVDYERLNNSSPEEYYKYKNVKLESIKSIAISESDYMLRRYSWVEVTPDTLYRYFGCVVMIETDPDGKVMVDGGKGIRKTSVHGYDTPQEFYSPDYSAMPLEKDYRRTLFWDPAILPDEKGKAKIKFYNNNNRSNFKIDAQTVTSTGALGTSQ